MGGIAKRILFLDVVDDKFEREMIHSTTKVSSCLDDKKKHHEEILMTSWALFEPDIMPSFCSALGLVSDWNPNDTSNSFASHKMYMSIL